MKSYHFLIGNRKRGRFWLDIALIALGITGLFIGRYFVSVLLLLVATLGLATNKKKVVSVSDKGVIYPFYRSKQFSWSEISNVILKDGMLTIDLADNRIIQNTVFNADINEPAFNEFCKLQLDIHSKKAHI